MIHNTFIKINNKRKNKNMKQISYTTPKSRLTYNFRNNTVITHSKTLQRDFITKGNSDRGRYLASLIARKARRNNYLNYETAKNHFKFKVGGKTIERLNKTNGQVSFVSVETAWGRDLASILLRKGEVV